MIVFQGTVKRYCFGILNAFLGHYRYAFILASWKCVRFSGNLILDCMVKVDRRVRVARGNYDENAF